MEKQNKHAYIWAVQGEPHKNAFGLIFVRPWFLPKILSCTNYIHLQDHNHAANVNCRNVKPRNVKCKPQPCNPLLRDLSYLNLLENGTKLDHPSSTTTTTTVSFICMTITTQHCKSVNMKFKNTTFPLQDITQLWQSQHRLQKPCAISLQPALPVTRYR